MHSLDDQCTNEGLRCLSFHQLADSLMMRRQFLLKRGVTCLYESRRVIGHTRTPHYKQTKLLAYEVRKSGRNSNDHSVKSYNLYWSYWRFLHFRLHFD